MTTMTGTTRQRAPETMETGWRAEGIPSPSPAAEDGQARSAVNHKATPRKRDPRKQDPEELRKFMARMLRAYARRAAQEDPGVLGDMLAMADDLHGLIDEVGRSLVDQVGASVVAGELGMTRQAAHKRWGGER
jgi:hypothetical protein